VLDGIKGLKQRTTTGFTGLTGFNFDFKIRAETKLINPVNPENPVNPVPVPCVRRNKGSKTKDIYGINRIFLLILKLESNTYF
jgi:hypothetical protein